MELVKRKGRENESGEDCSNNATRRMRLSDLPIDGLMSLCVRSCVLRVFAHVCMCLSWMHLKSLKLKKQGKRVRDTVDPARQCQTDE